MSVEKRVFILDSHKPKVTRAWLEAHEPTVIIKAIVGDDSIDLVACKELGVSVLQVDYGHDVPCSEWCIRALLELEGARRREVSGKSAVVVGSAGRIGSLLCRKLYALGVSPISFDKKLGHSREDLLERLRKADYCFVCCPLTLETQGLIGVKELEALGKDGVLACVSRVDVCDVAEVSRFVAGGGRFAVDSDDLMDGNLRAWVGTRVFITPHICGYTVGANARRAQSILKVFKDLGVEAGIVIK